MFARISAFCTASMLCAQVGTAGGKAEGDCLPCEALGKGKTQAAEYASDILSCIDRWTFGTTLSAQERATAIGQPDLVWQDAESALAQVQGFYELYFGDRAIKASTYGTEDQLRLICTALWVSVEQVKAELDTQQ